MALICFLQNIKCVDFRRVEIKRHIFVQEPSQKIKLSLTCIFTIILIFIDYKHQQFSHLRTLAAKVVYPIYSLVDAPINFMRVGKSYMMSMEILLQENILLHEEKLLEKGRLQSFTALETENVYLQKLLNCSVTSKEELLIARVLSIDPNPLVHQFFLNKGSVHGVYIGQPVIDFDGVMGAVINVELYTCRVMLLTDPSQSIPVENVRNGIRSIISGIGLFDTLKLQHIPNTIDIIEGDFDIITFSNKRRIY